MIFNTKYHTIIRCVLIYLYYFQPFINKQQIVDDLRIYFNNDFLFCLIVSCVSTFGTYLIFAGFFSVSPFLKIPFIEKYKSTDKKWGFEDKNAPEYCIFWTNFKNTIYQLPNRLFVEFILGLIDVCISYSNPNFYKIESNTTAFINIFKATMISDIVFYFVHKLFHKTQLYAYHKSHHEYKELYVSAVLHIDTLDVIISAVPFALGILIFDFDIYTKFLYMTMLHISVIFQHSGYHVPWFDFAPTPFITPHKYHQLHHIKQDKNYGSTVFLMDWLFGDFLDDSIAQN